MSDWAIVSITVGGAVGERRPVGYMVGRGPVQDEDDCNMVGLGLGMGLGLLIGRTNDTTLSLEGVLVGGVENNDIVVGAAVGREVNDQVAMSSPSQTR
jgi:hypothetical protein